MALTVDLTFVGVSARISRSLRIRSLSVIASVRCGRTHQREVTGNVQEREAIRLEMVKVPMHSDLVSEWH